MTEDDDKLSVSPCGSVTMMLTLGVNDTMHAESVRLLNPQVVSK